MAARAVPKGGGHIISYHIISYHVISYHIVCHTPNSLFLLIDPLSLRVVNWGWMEAMNGRAQCRLFGTENACIFSSRQIGAKFPPFACISFLISILGIDLFASFIPSFISPASIHSQENYNLERRTRQTLKELEKGVNEGLAVCTVRVQDCVCFGILSLSFLPSP